VSFHKHVPATLKADELRAFHVQEWIEANSKIKVAVTKKWKKVRTKTTSKQISPTTEGDRIGLIKSAMSWAKAMGYIESNPIEDMPKPEPRVRQEYVPADLWPRVLEMATDQPFHDFLTVMLSAGARPQEMFKFCAEHFDTKGKRLVLEIENSKGKRKSRVVYLPPDALEVVERLAAQYPAGKLFRNRKGNAWTKNSIRCRFRYLKEKLGMPNLCATTLRHSYAHFRLTNGQDALTVAKLMGHVDTRMVSTRYGHLEENSDYMQQAASQIPLPISSTARWARSSAGNWIG
jgi:integrase